MWANKKRFFFIPGPFQGGHFLGGIIYSSALDLKNLKIATLNCTLAMRHRERGGGGGGRVAKKKWRWLG
jgi:hypothetical protein